MLTVISATKSDSKEDGTNSLNNRWTGRTEVLAKLRLAKLLYIVWLGLNTPLLS